MSDQGQPRKPPARECRLELLAALTSPQEQVVLVFPDTPSDAATGSPLPGRARTRATAVTAWMSESQAAAFAAAGFALFEARSRRDEMPTAFLCREVVCRLPTTDHLDI